MQWSHMTESPKSWPPSVRPSGWVEKGGGIVPDLMADKYMWEHKSSITEAPTGLLQVALNASLATPPHRYGTRELPLQRANAPPMGPYVSLS
jgi:hypothetical protein